MMISVIIPYMEAFAEKRQILEKTLDSFSGADEIIVVENWREGYAVPINFGLSQAKGDFLIVMNDDLDLHGASLRELCDEFAVVSPTVNGQTQPFWGCCFSIPRKVYEKVGGLWEGYRISYYDDADYYQMLKKADVAMYCVGDVQVSTEGGTTLDSFPDRNEFFQENHQKYIDRWGGEPEF